MFGYSEKTTHWIIGYFLFNLFAIVYIYLFFFDGWISTVISVITSLFVWEMLIFGVLAPDEVFMEVIGEVHSPPSNSGIIRSPLPSVRDVIVSSGDH
ncbi:hypothetical protein L5515_011883 [Caenorhabditis briggsae]|uniref:Uncharacterized protein n=1 Tax=Caenorhabditis briggsae TaxID=6238 RepID=A0AAE9EW29_CAEBR|nr:hypothetical protein L5515_011883 [Caenorhabditis briggsae]